MGKELDGADVNIHFESRRDQGTFAVVFHIPRTDNRGNILQKTIVSEGELWAGYGTPHRCHLALNSFIIKFKFLKVCFVLL
jgi:hypothetical protein